MDKIGFGEFVFALIGISLVAFISGVGLGQRLCFKEMAQIIGLL